MAEHASEPQPGEDGDLHLVEDVLRAAREIVTARLVHKSVPMAESLIKEHLLAHGDALIWAVAMFIEETITSETPRALAEDRFFYSITRVGNLLTLMAEVEGRNRGDLVLELVRMDFGDVEELGRRERDAYLAAQTCLVSHLLVRWGRRSWGIQSKLEEADMLDVSAVLARMIVVVALAFDAQHSSSVLENLLDEMEHLLRVHARAHGVALEEYIAMYFTHLAQREDRIA